MQYNNDNQRIDGKRVIDTNGTKYLVGWDDHGWFNIQHVELYHDEETGEPHAEPVGKYPTMSFTPAGIDDLLAEIDSER